MSVEVSLSKTEKRVLKASAVMMLILALFFFNDRLFYKLFGYDDRDLSKSYIADVISIQNDVRQKTARTYQWSKIPGIVKLGNGDAVFTGEGSKTVVMLRDGVKVEIDEQSLIKFQADSDNIGDLKFGSIHLEGSGDVRLKVNGETVTVPLTGGPVDVKVNGASFEAKNKNGIVIAKKTAPKNMNFPPVLLPSDSVHTFWSLYDLYERQDANLHKKAVPHFITQHRDLQWKDLSKGPFHLQLADNAKFQGNLFDVNPPDKIFKTVQVYVGPNFWRVSSPNGQWSQIQQFDVNPEFVPGLPKITSLTTENVPYFDKAVSSQLKWDLPASLTSTLIEISEDRTFPNNATLVRWTKATEAELPWPRAATYYVRLRGLDENLHVAAFSGTSVYAVGTPPLLGRVKLPKGDLNYTLNDKSHPQLFWKSPAGAVKNHVEVFDKKGKKLAETDTVNQSLDFKKKLAGSYSYRVTPIDRWGRPGQMSNAKPFQLNPPPSIVAKKEQPRKVASEELKAAPKMTTEAKLPPQYLNQMYNSSIFALEGASFAMLTSQQDQNGVQTPLAGTMTTRWTKWWNTLGMEWSYQGKVFNYNAPATQVDPIDLRVSMMRRLSMPWHWYSFLRELQVSGIFGYESYSNRTSDTFIYSRGYNLLKTGLQLEFPMSYRWESGGEATLGDNFNGVILGELSGHFSYFLKKNWSLGIGYRAHLMNSSTLQYGPTDPYREAYGEGYTTLQYHY